MTSEKSSSKDSNRGFFLSKWWTGSLFVVWVATGFAFLLFVILYGVFLCRSVPSKKDNQSYLRYIAVPADSSGVPARTLVVATDEYWHQKVSIAIDLFALLSIMMALAGGSAYLIGFAMQNKLHQDFAEFRDETEQKFRERQRELDHNLEERIREIEETVQARVERNVVQNLAHLFRDREG